MNGGSWEDLSVFVNKAPLTKDDAVQYWRIGGENADVEAKT